jgi:protein-S-isoprenylcysteine O-methyltransferase Ste14
MPRLTAWQADLLPWYVFAAYWAVSAWRVKRTKAAEKPADRLATILAMVVVFLLLFRDKLRIGPLGWRFAAGGAWTNWGGVILTGLGVAAAIWARYCLGQYWSARVTLKQEHRLIQSGPYAYVRHPIYAGMLMAAIGTALVVGEWRGVLAVAVMLVTHSRKAAREEALLAGEFGNEYEEYRRHTGALFPRWSRS